MFSEAGGALLNPADESLCSGSVVLLPLTHVDLFFSDEETLTLKNCVFFPFSGFFSFCL